MDAGDDLAPRDFGIDDGFAAAPAVVDHYNEILHVGDLVHSREMKPAADYF